MITIPETDKKIRQRISSYKSAMNKEKRTRGTIRDSSGKRYIIFWLYLILNDLKGAAAYVDWYTDNFPDDVGEPCQKLCLATLLFRMDRKKEARHQLADAMLSNLYMIPFILNPDIEQSAFDMWHSCSWENPDYMEDIPPEVLAAITPADREWITSCFNSRIFTTIRTRYVEIFHELQNLEDMDRRKALLDESRGLLNMLEENSEPEVRILFQVSPDPDVWH